MRGIGVVQKTGRGFARVGQTIRRIELQILLAGQIKRIACQSGGEAHELRYGIRSQPLGQCLHARDMAKTKAVGHDKPQTRNILCGRQGEMQCG